LKFCDSKEKLKLFFSRLLNKTTIQHKKPLFRVSNFFYITQKMEEYNVIRIFNFFHFIKKINFFIYIEFNFRWKKDEHIDLFLKLFNETQQSNSMSQRKNDTFNSWVEIYDM